MYKKVDTKLNFIDRELDMLKFWKEENIFEKSIKERKDCENFTFYDGPPTANGKPHIGHVLTRVIKDLIPRYKTMKGYHVDRKAGWDTHGLPVELEIEKQLGISGKPQIENFGVEEFIKKCKESVWTYKGQWEDMSDRVGFWVDMDNPYITYDNKYIESVWWSLRQIWDKELIYKGHKIVPYCPRCGTSLSSHEVAQGYKDIKDITAIVKFKVIGQDNTYILAWTTTPWTLPSNVALCVNPTASYVKAKLGDEFYILAESLVPSVLGEEAKIVKTYIGKDLVKTKYKPLFDFATLKEDEEAWFVVADDYVTLSDGTGVVHIAPAFGEDDARIGREYGLPFIQLVNEQGFFTPEVTPWQDVFVKDADKLIIRWLKRDNALFKSLPHEHSYPHCWRCDTPLLYYARDTWFIAMSKVRDKLVANNKTVNWYPPSIGEGRFGNFLENVIDWGLSRSRYWGTPLPIWECNECGYKHLIGSVQELKDMSSDCPEKIELHKPNIDRVHLNCPKCSAQMKRVDDVIDCWYDSGSMPFAQFHYPFENKELFEEHFPANFISEGVDQTRGWFYTLMAISTLIFDKAPYKNVVVLGHICDKDGAKMSKSKGNVIAPNDILDVQGADAIRWYFYSTSASWIPNRLSIESVSENQRKFIGTFWNTYAFYILYANIDEFDPTKYTLDKASLSMMDKWVLSKLNTLVKEVDENLSDYHIYESARAMQDFIDGVSNWYVRRSRERFWQSGMPQDKINAYMTLYTVLDTLSKISAPFIPFMSEEIYQNLVRTNDKSTPESVHLCDFPSVDESFIDKRLEDYMESVLQIVALGRACRNESNIKNRQPIGKMYVGATTELPSDFINIVAEELNVKQVEFTKDANELIDYAFKPQMRTLGPKYGKLLNAIRTKLTTLNGVETMDKLNSTGVITLDIEGQNIELTRDDLLISTAQREGYVSQSENGFTVVIDTTLSPELIEEGFVREIISKIQTMRKEADFEVQDNINIGCTNNDRIQDICKRNKETITSETLAKDIVYTAMDGYSKEWNVNGEDVTFTVCRL
ncbi:isoleucine--tRNA ligase [Candidatus Epulonipiscium fishelsonii]|uniref:Isoleucine--tRNA ligase n=1 Tax=Candidatus Epulonipiscium fishelsonii TaxID=77094 RepID=A0ACC8XD24_9FIRM|nr:isoleucine--tRNA ligase [Epulopiscium sp. SCG-B05WGA-EpuloA1]ONI40766.1 isoleucine--tRNA ligase [Epulopiscium sp. SCG-B11WGA-EpuloA1]